MKEEFNKIKINNSKAEKIFRNKKYARGKFRIEFSWLYIIQSTRNSGILYYNDQNYFIIVKKKNKIVLVSHSLKAPNKIINFLKNEFGSKNIIFKNILTKEKDIFLNLGLREYKRNESWDIETKYDDQTFPERILNCYKSIKLIERKREFKKILKKDFTCKKYNIKYHKKGVLSLLKKLSKKNKQIYFAHKDFLNLQTSRNRIIKIIKYENEIIAFIAIDKISTKTKAVLASIYSKEIYGLTTYLLYYICKSCSNCTFLNLQGSETSSLDKFKLKFKPQISFLKEHLVLEGKNDI